MPSSTSEEGPNPREVYRAYEVHAARSRMRRLAGSAVGIAGGGAFFSIGVVAKNAEAPLADLWLVLGGVSAGFGALTLLLKRSAKPSTFILIE